MEQKISKYLHKLKSDFIITGSFALFLQSKKNKVKFNRNVKDLDLYIINDKDLLLKENNFFNEFKIKNNNIYRISETIEADFYLDIFSNNFLMDTVPPSEELYEKISINKKYYKLSKIEHIFLLKLFTKYKFRDKEYSDLNFICKNFELDIEICKKIHKKSKFKSIHINWEEYKINNQFIENLISKFESYLISKHKKYFPDTNRIPYCYMCVLFDIDLKLKNNYINQEILEVFSEPQINLIINFSYYILFTKKNYNHLKIFEYILNSIKVNNIEEFLTLIVIRSKFVNKLISENTKEDKIIELLEKERFLINYFKLIS